MTTPEPDPSADPLESSARLLEESGEYKVVRRYRQPTAYAEDDGSPTRSALFLDTETTGLDPASDKVIELGMVRFSYALDGRIFRIEEEYDGFEDPGRPIPAVITRITGITDDMVRGHRLDDARVAEMVGRADLIIAHNASFDRQMIEPRYPLFADKAWACSIQDVPWSAEGMESAKLEYLAYQFGFFYEGHRAVHDCKAGIHLLAQTLPGSGRPAMAALLESARGETRRIWAEGSAFETKDLLKARGYRWHADRRCWYTDVPAAALEDELAWLRADIFRTRRLQLPVDTLNAFTRYSSRV